MIKFCKTVLSMMLAMVCVAAISGSTLFLKVRYDQAIEAAVQERSAHMRLDQWRVSDGLSLPDLGSIEEPPGRQKVVSSFRDAAIAQSIIDEELRDASPEEREIWSQELKGRSPQEVREILSLRHQFSLPRNLNFDDDVQFTSSVSQPPRTLPEISVASASPMPADALAQVAPSIEAVQVAEQALLQYLESQIASMDALRAELHRLREQLQALQEQHAKPTDSSPDN
jgi:hypothetical protein